jgi:DNA-binding transcriptional ArsR family regulator
MASARAVIEQFKRRGVCPVCGETGPLYPSEIGLKLFIYNIHSVLKPFEREWKLKEVELKLIAELMKNSRRSDRELAKAVGTSQPTVSRTISRLEKQGVIKEYTMIPDFTKLGYEIIALTFITINPKLSPREADEARATAQKLMEENAGIVKEYGIIMLERGLGLNRTGAIISFHKTYSDYSRFIQDFRQDPTAKAYVHGSVESFLINLKEEMHYRSLTLRALANHILRMNQQKES